MTTLLREALQAASGPVATAPPEHEIERRSRRLHRRTRLLEGGAAAIVLLLVVAWAVLPDGGAPTVRTTGTAEQTTVTDEGSVDWGTPPSTAVTTASSVVGSRATSSVPSGVVPEVFPTTPPPPGFVGRPPPGARLAFTAMGRIETMRPDGTDRRVLLDDGKVYRLAGWSPKRDRLAVLDGHVLRILDVEQGTLTTVVDRVDAGTGVEAADWSPDGKWLVYSARTTTGGTDPSTWHNLRLVRPDGSDDHEIPVRGCGPVWAPDAKRIAAASCGGSGSQLDMVVAAADGSQRTTLPGKHMYAVSWSPDGSWLAGFPYDEETLFTDGEVRRLTLFRPDGSDTRTLPSGSSWQRPAWTTDSSHLIYASYPEDVLEHPCGPPPAASCDERASGLYSIAVDGSGEVELTSTGENQPMMPWR